ncbi:MAG: tRNA (N(6)-L-threonylcarbamoyladenosine(37)-C(2))-methylthiotransferase MtaB [Chloroflexi bacterium]|nr:tRNA (N(6)-L-threonylcarbamoyladenosine(37)-C(2))-methylthiotransferase MtaB [Chloroflexota bacterium]
MPTVAIETHGCKLNQADSQAVAREFARAGFLVVDPGQPADVYVLNTCTVTHIADRKARHALGWARRQNPSSLVVATGCYAQRAREELVALDSVDLVLGNTEKGSLVERVAMLLGDVPRPRGSGQEQGHGVGAATWKSLRTRAMVKIQEGCDQVCAYCIVPRVRGRERSVPPGDLLSTVLSLQERGVQEVVLTGTQLGTYGFDLSDTGLTRLLEMILAKTTIHRIRVSSLQPQEIGEELLSLWADRRLCPHFHIPLQSGSNTVLKGMRRRYTSEVFANAVALVRKHIPDVAITTDVIAGFPGEGEEEFEETYLFCRDMGFADMHVFPFSMRPGTSAAYFRAQVNSRTRARRGEVLQRLARDSATRFRSYLLGQVRPVLWERRVRRDGRLLWSGLTDNYVRVLTENPMPLANKLAAVRLTGESEEALWGNVV